MKLIIIFLIICLIFFILFHINKKNKELITIKKNYDKNNRLLVLFVFHKYNSRVINFIKKAIFYHKYIDFIIISNNKKIKIKAPSYVKVIYRDNIGYDFGGWSDALLKNDLYKKYSKFLFVNSSVIGPFIKDNYKGLWVDLYLNGLQGDVKLFGSTINNLNKPKKLAHIQSYIFCMDKKTLDYLIDCEIFSLTNYAKKFSEAIRKKEILMSRLIIQNDWNIGSLMKQYKNVDFRFKIKKPSDYKIKFLNDVMFPRYKYKYWKPTDLVFIKGNR